MLKQPVTQKRLTNVAIVRLKYHGKRFEIAAYKNKVLNWREGIEKDINEVLQVITVFTNVSKGDVAKDQDLKEAFGTTDQEEICRKILKSGDLQVSDREREVHLEGLFRDIVQIVVERCVHPQTGRQLTALTVESALKNIGFSVQPEHTAKRQALKAIESLCAEIPESFARAKMRLRITAPEKLREEVRRHLLEEAGAQVEDETVAAATGGLCSFTFMCDPSHYRELDRFATATFAGEDVSLQVVTATVLREGDGLLGGGAGGSAVAHPQPAGETSGRAAAAAERPPPTADRAAAAPGRTPGPQAAAQQQEPRKKGFRCSSCDTGFEDAAEYRQHCRSEWHNFNIKRKFKTLPPVSADEYEEISLDVREGFLAVES